MAAPLLIYNIGQLVTCQPLVEEQRFSAIQSSDLGILENAWLALENGSLAALGSGSIPQAYQAWPSHDAQGALVTPGLVDCHTHPIFGGDRTHEFAARLDGATYQEIAARGGGIKSTIRHTRAASNTILKEKTLERLQNFLRWGVTTVETKSGYGQSVDEELRLLRILNEVATISPQTLAITCLALHDVPHDAPSKAEFIAAMSEQLLPQVAAEGLASWVDAFVEDGYFSVEECRPLIEKARSLGFKIRLHADEFAASGAAEAAAAWQAASADHLQKVSDQGIAAMQKAGTVAVLLPGTSFYTRIPYTSAARLRQAACPIAVASDFNPGSCYIPNLPFAAGLAALYCGLSVAESLVAVTWNAARSLRLEQRKGALAPHFDGDLVIHTCQRIEQWIADLGQTRPAAVFIGGVRQ